MKGHVLLREHLPGMGDSSLPDTFPSVQWVDLAQHMERMWGHYVGAVSLHSPANVYPERFERTRSLFAAWQASDPVPGRI
jgi:hypothetical protein